MICLRARSVGVYLLLASVQIVGPCGAALGQTSEGSIRGTVKDEQGGVLAGVSVMASSTDIPGVHTAISDQAGFYRLTGLPPGRYVVAAELPGFARVLQDNVLVRAGLNLGVDFVMHLGAVEQTVEVSAETSLLETRSATTAINVSGTFQRALPLSTRRNWFDFLWLAPGVTNTDSLSVSQTAFFVNGADSASHVIQLDGADVAASFNSGTGYLFMSAEVLDDVQVKTAAVDASAPLGQGAVMNVVTRSGTNSLKGSAALLFQGRSWSSSNNPGGTTTAFGLWQPEASVGGPLVVDRAWWFGVYRQTDITEGIGRTPAQLAAASAFVPQFEPFDNHADSTQTFAKTTIQLSRDQQFSAFHQYGADKAWQLTPTDTVRSRRGRTGGHSASARLSSVWTPSLTSRLGVAYNNQVNPSTMTITDRPGRPVHQRALASGGRLLGTGILTTLDNWAPANYQDATSGKLTVTADLTWYQTGWLGSHELQAGLYLQPHRRIEYELNYSNDGFILEELVLRDPNNPAVGTIPFHRQIFDDKAVVLLSTNTQDYAAYIQDAWIPHPRITLNLGVRLDMIKRRDLVFEEDFQDTLAIGPRVGINTSLSSDRRHILRASWSRLHDAVSGLSLETVGSNRGSFTDHYDVNLDGVFETRLVTPAVSRSAFNRVVDIDSYRQPHADELTVGYTHQLPSQITFDAAVVRRAFRDRQALLEVNGIYDGGVFRGYRNETANEIYRLTSNTYNWPVYTALELRAAKQSGRLQLIGSYTRQWRHLSGTWQPGDPASFIQPEAFPNDRGIGGVRFPITQNSLSGSDMTVNSSAWKDHVVRTAATFIAPWRIHVAGSYTVQSGGWSGPVVTRVPADPSFGPTTVTLSNGRAVLNPLATQIRFAYGTRGEGQLRLPTAHTFNLRFGRDFHLARMRVRPGVDILNVVNGGASYQFGLGANQLYSANYGAFGPRQPPRSAQASVRVEF